MFILTFNLNVEHTFQCFCFGDISPLQREQDRVGMSESMSIFIFTCLNSSHVSDTKQSNFSVKKEKSILTLLRYREACILSVNVASPSIMSHSFSLTLPRL